METPEPTPSPMPAECRAETIVDVVETNKGDDLRNAWECLIEFHRIAKEMDSPMSAPALRAAAFVNRLRAAYEQ